MKALTHTTGFIEQCRIRDQAFLHKQTRSKLDESMNESLQTLKASPDGFTFTPTASSLELNGLKVHHNAELCHFGELDQLDSSVQKFLLASTNLGTEVALAAGQQIQAVTGAFLRQIHQQTAMVMVRTFPTRPVDFKPRWHMDGTYMGGQDETKLVWSLAGRGTLVAAPTDQQREILNGLFKDQRQSRSPEKTAATTAQIDALVAEAEPRSAPDASQATLFRVGGHPQSCLHSEPAFDQERIFVAVVPTNPENLAVLRERFELASLIGLGNRLAEGTTPPLAPQIPGLDTACEFWGEAALPALQNMLKSKDPAWVAYATEKIELMKSKV